jgi:hypothetical protein
LHIHCHGNLFTEPLPSNGRILWLHYSGLHASCHNNVWPRASFCLSEFHYGRRDFDEI